MREGGGRKRPENGEDRRGGGEREKSKSGEKVRGEGGRERESNIKQRSQRLKREVGLRLR